MTSPRICIVSQEYPATGGYYGGIGTQYGALAPSWAASGAEVHVVTLRPRGQEVPPRIEGVHVHALEPPRAWPWVAVSQARRVCSVMRDLGRFDAVISPEFRGEAALYAADQADGPLVTHLLTSTAQLLSLRPGLTQLERHGLRTRLYLSLERRQTERSRAIFAAGGAILSWARELWPEIASVKTRVLPLTIRVGEVRELAEHGELPPGFPVRAGRPLVALPSRLDGHKGADLLLGAMQQVWRSHPEAQLVYIGRDARFGRTMMSERLRELAGEHAERLHFTGALAQAQYFAAVAACDVVAIPSLWESFCLAAVEAMALGRPVIGTRGHGFDEYLHDDENGLMVDRGAVVPLAEAITRLLESPELRTRLGAAARTTADALDVPQVARRYLEGLAEL